MKVAEAQYTGPMRSVHRHAEDGTLYAFRNPMGGTPRSTPIYDMQLAERLDKQDVFDVNWTVQGEVSKRVQGPLDNAQSVLSEISYRQKQKLTTALGLNVQANSKEEELEEALEPAVEDMINSIEVNNRR